MAEEGKPPTTPGTPGAGGSGSGGTRKIAGKYNSVEDAIESLAGSHEKNYHETREEIGAIKQLLERALTSPVGSNSDRGDQGYERGRRSDFDPDDDIDPTEFLAKPGAVLRRREEKLQKQWSERVAAHNAAMINNAAAVLRFQMKNPDLDDHENLVQGFLKDTNDRDPLAKRLNEAAKKTRAYLAKLKGKDEDDPSNGDGHSGRSPDPDEFVEGPARAGGGLAPKGRTEDDEDGDDSLSKHIQEQRAWKAKRFQGAPSRDKS